MTIYLDTDVESEFRNGLDYETERNILYPISNADKREYNCRLMFYIQMKTEFEGMEISQRRITA